MVSCNIALLLVALACVALFVRLCLGWFALLLFTDICAATLRLYLFWWVTFSTDWEMSLAVIVSFMVARNNPFRMIANVKREARSLQTVEAVCYLTEGRHRHDIGMVRGLNFERNHILNR